MAKFFPPGSSTNIESNIEASIEVISILLQFFIDAFGLYRNMYRLLIGYYLFNAALKNKDRNRRANIILLTLGLYSCNLPAVIEAVGPILTALDASIEIELANRTKKIVYIFTFVFISNTP